MISYRTVARAGFGQAVNQERLFDVDLTTTLQTADTTNYPIQYYLNLGINYFELSKTSLFWTTGVTNVTVSLISRCSRPNVGFQRD